MEQSERLTDHKLIIDINRKETEIEMIWTGKSIRREPETFIYPLLLQLQEECGEIKSLILNFKNINSSTISPLAYFLESCLNGKTKVKVYYDNHIKWQELGFNALKIFITQDGRIQIIGKKNEPD